LVPRNWAWTLLPIIANTTTVVMITAKRDDRHENLCAPSMT
jgi:hypothetical protein